MRLGGGRYRLGTICFLVNTVRNKQIKIAEFDPTCMTALPRGELRSSFVSSDPLSSGASVLRFYRSSYDHSSKVFTYNYMDNSPNNQE